MRAVLYNKFTRVMEAEVENGIVTELGDVFHEDRLPLRLQNRLTVEEMNKWLEKRRIPLNREGLKEVKQMFSAQVYQPDKYMFALTDQYWFRYTKKDTWQRLNYFTNPYSSAVGESLFTPWTVTMDELKKGGPDLTTNGVLRKVWVQDPETLDSYLIKAGSRTFYQQPLSEVLASMTLDVLHIVPFVRYDLNVHGMRICSKCRNFVNEHTEFIPAQAVFSRKPRRSDMTPLEHLILMCEEYGAAEPREFISKMLYCDHLIGNTDRHMGNFGLLKNVETNEVIGFAPLFDFGSAFSEYRPPRKKEKPLLFEEDLPRIIRKYERMPVMKKLTDRKPFFRLIDTYPDLTVSQKDAIKQGIVERTRKFEYGEQDKSKSR